MINLNNKLNSGINELNLIVSKENQAKLINFLYFLEKWNRVYNLTAITDLEKMVTHHLLDSLAIASYIKDKSKILDVGSGAGFPGIPLAIYYPDKHFTLLDSNGKKTRFLNQAKAEFHLENVEVVQSRMENYHTQGCFDAIIFRAVGNMAEMWPKTEHLCCENGSLMFMKGIYPQQELSQLNQAYKAYPVDVPGLEAKRHLVIMEKTLG